VYRLPLTWYPRRGPRPHREGLYFLSSTKRTISTISIRILAYTERSFLGRPKSCFLDTHLLGHLPLRAIAKSVLTLPSMI
jgi:hypothetical protein